MSDITLCTNSTCGKRERCYRYSAKAHESWQSYSYFKPNENGECEHFISLEKCTRPLPDLLNWCDPTSKEKLVDELD